ncbi:hypothetical protein POUND7_019297 [Theobroma cacao]
MQDDGNFVLRESSSRVIWRSFDFPTDTILLGQNLVMGQKLYSNANGTVDYSTGRYMLEVQGLDGNVVLSAFKFADAGYWNTATNGRKNVSLTFNQSAALMSVLVYHKENGTQWTMVWEAITEPCTVVSICGVFGFCTLPDNRTVSCECLRGYLPWDPNNPSKGCYPDVTMDFCAPESSASDFKIEQIDDADFPSHRFADLERIKSMDVNECKNKVMEDCFCMAAVLDGTDCIKKRMPLLNGRRSNPSTNNKVAFIKVPNMNTSSPDKDKKDSPSTVSLLAGLILCLLVKVVMLLHLLAVTGFAFVLLIFDAFCGVNSLCNSANNETSRCSCLPGFIPVDETNLSKGWHPETLINYCEDHSLENFMVQVMDDTGFPARDFEDLSRILNTELEGCKKAVMEDCYTMAASLEDSTCHRKRYPLLNARKTASTIGIKAIIKVPRSTGNPDFRRDKRTKKISSQVVLKIGLIVIATLAFLLAATAVYYHPAVRRLMKRKSSLNVDAIGVGFREFTFQELHDATNGFDNRSKMKRKRGSQLQIDSVLHSFNC